MAKRIGEIGRTDAHGALVDLGLLPNYSLIDVSTTLEATLTWQEDDGQDGAKRYHSELREYTRPARQALTELAPGNHFYIRGYRHDVTGLDIGTPRPGRPGSTGGSARTAGYVREGLDAAGRQPLPALRQRADRRRERPAQGAQAGPRHLPRPARRRPDRRR